MKNKSVCLERFLFGLGVWTIVFVALIVSVGCFRHSVSAVKFYDSNGVRIKDSHDEYDVIRDCDYDFDALYDSVHTALMRKGFLFEVEDRV